MRMTLDKWPYGCTIKQYITLSQGDLPISALGSDKPAYLLAAPMRGSDPSTLSTSGDIKLKLLRRYIGFEDVTNNYQCIINIELGVLPKGHALELSVNPGIPYGCGNVAVPTHEPLATTLPQEMFKLEKQLHILLHKLLQQYTLWYLHQSVPFLNMTIRISC
jgi:hypothetical protein